MPFLVPRVSLGSHYTRSPSLHISFSLSLLSKGVVILLGVLAPRLRRDVPSWGNRSPLCLLLFCVGVGGLIEYACVCVCACVRYGIVFRFPFPSFLVLPTCKYKCTCACGRSVHLDSIQKVHRHDWRTNLETHHLFVLVCSKRPQQLSFVVHSLVPIAWRQAPHVLRLPQLRAPSTPPFRPIKPLSIPHLPPRTRTRKRWRRQPGRCRLGPPRCWPSSSWGWQTTRPKASRCAWGSRTTCPRPWLLSCVCSEGRGWLVVCAVCLLEA